MIKKVKTLRVKFTIITIFTYLILILSLLSVCYAKLNTNMIKTYSEIGENILNLAINEIDVNEIPIYMNGGAIKNYINTKHRLARYMDFSNEIDYIYAMQISEDKFEGTYIFDVDTETEQGDVVGTTYELDPEFKKRIKDFRKGVDIEPLTGNTQYGYLLTCSKPLKNINGQTMGYLFIDFNMTKIRDNNLQFVFSLFIMMLVVASAITILGMGTVSKRITSPIEKIYLCLKDFKFDTDEDRRLNVVHLKDLNIKTNVEITSLYNALCDIVEHSYEYQHDLNIAQDKLEDMEDLAYLDTMTGVKNKASYEIYMKELQQMVDSARINNLAVVMADINNLKYVNDTFGHQAGDSYIEGSVQILKSCFLTKNIFRLGGDEFLVVITSRYNTRFMDLDKCENILEELQKNIELKPYERYSISLGMATWDRFDSTLSRSMVDLVKKADAIMYENKKAYKEKYGSYR